MTLSEMRKTLGDTASRGSKIRCHVLTSGSPGEVAARLSAMLPVAGCAVSSQSTWLPRGLDDVTEAQLDKHTQFLGRESAQSIRDWWLASPKNAATPNWDIASSFSLEGMHGHGLLLVEAKAHVGELSAAGKSAPSDSEDSLANDRRIRDALSEASTGLGEVVAGFRLSAERHYQISNRFAWAWKVASFGIPVVLVYLGFLNALDMAHDGRIIFATDSAWDAAVRDHSRSVIPGSAWNRMITVGDAWVFPAIVARETPV